MTSSRIPIAIIAAGLIIAGAVYLTVSSSATPRTLSGTGNPLLVRPVDSRDHILGNPAADIQIIEYSDYDCEFCRTFHGTMEQVLADRGSTGKIAWVFRQFPLVELHPNARNHALAAECVALAGGNDAFWAFTHDLFVKQPVSPTDYGALAEKQRVPADAFRECYSDAEARVGARIDADRKNALDSGAIGTPFSLILAPGKAPIVLEGAYTSDAIEAILDKLLQ